MHKFYLEELRRLSKNSTKVVAWYPHSQYDGYHPGKASVRGPFGRWLLVEGGESGTPDGKLGHGVADLYDDAKFAAAAMNSLSPLLDFIESLQQKNAHLRKVVDIAREVGEELDVFLGVSQKIHFPDAREASSKLKNALLELDKENKTCHDCGESAQTLMQWSEVNEKCLK